MDYCLCCCCYLCCRDWFERQLIAVATHFCEQCCLAFCPRHRKQERKEEMSKSHDQVKEASEKGPESNHNVDSSYGSSRESDSLRPPSPPRMTTGPGGTGDAIPRLHPGLGRESPYPALGPFQIQETVIVQEKISVRSLF